MDPAADPAVAPRLRRPAAVALAAYVALSLLLSHALWSDPLHRTVQGGDGDPGLFTWFLANTAHALQHGGRGLLVSHALNVPDGVCTMWNTGLLLPGIALTPVTLLAGPVLSLNLVVLLGPALSAWSAFLCSGRWLTTGAARFAAGLVFGFSPAVMAAQLGHYHLTILVLVPPLLVAVVDLATRRGPAVRTGLRLGVLTGAQLLVGEEVLALTAVAAAVLLLVLAAQRPRAALRRAPSVLAGGGVALVAALAVAGWPLAVQFSDAQRVSGAIQRPDTYVLDPLNLVLPTPVQVLSPSAGAVASAYGKAALNQSETMGYVGVPLLLLLLVVAVLRRRDPVVRTALLTSLVLGVLSLGYTLHLAGSGTGLTVPWAAAEHVPVLAHLLPVRWFLVVDLLLALVVGRVLEALPRERTGRLLGTAVVVLALLPLVPAPLPDVADVPTPAFFRAGAPGLHGTALVVPMSTPPSSLAMTWQAEAGLAYDQPGGYFVGRRPDGSAGFGPAVRRPTTAVLQRVAGLGESVPVTWDVAEHAREDLAHWGVRAVVLVPGPHEQVAKAFLTALLRAEPERTGGVWLWRDVDPARV